MYPIIYSFGKISIYSHGLLTELGIVVGGLIFFYQAKKEKISPDLFALVLLWSIIGGIVGARILYVLLYLNQFSSWLDVISIWNGGLVSFGGMAGALVTAGVILKLKKQSVLQWFDLAIPAFMAGWAIGRIGCFLNGDSTGVTTTSIWGIWGRYPTALYETVLLLIISGVCLALSKPKKNIWSSGLIFSLGLGLYGFGRFWIDMVQAEPVWFWHLKYGQLGSVLTMIIAITLIVALNRRGARKEKNARKNCE